MLLGQVGPISYYHGFSEKVDMFSARVSNNTVEKKTVDPNYIWAPIMGEGGVPTKMNIGLGEQIDLRA